MAASAILLDLLNLKSRRNALTMEQVLLSKKGEDFDKLAANWAKKSTNAQDLYDKVMYGDKNVEFRGKTYTVGNEYYARQYVYDKLGYEYDEIEYNMEYFQELDNEYDTLKTMNETQLTSLDTQIKTWEEKLAQTCQTTNIVGGGN